MQMSQPNQQIGRENTVGSNNGSRPCSAIKKKSTGISPNSKAVKQLNLISGGLSGTAGLGR